MIVEDQQDVIEFLASPRTHGGAGVERIDTHTAVVFLAGTHAYKLKRAVRFDYVDFSTLDRRHRFCEAEVRLNRRTAPGLYLGICPVTRQPDGHLDLGGTGEVVEWLVDMQRFDQDQLLDRLASNGRLDLEVMATLAGSIAAFHDGAEPRLDHGGRKGMAWVIDGNAAGFEEFGTGLDPDLRARVTRVARETLHRHSKGLEARRQAGQVRRCHGDLHLRNIVLLDGRPTLFDGVEFNDEIACIDVMYDLAFLLMDLLRRRLPRHANLVLNRYLADTADLDALRLLPMFLSCRAAVRAKTSATAAAVQGDARRGSDLQDLATEYLVMAERLLHPPSPCLIAIGGLSGSGKSTVALGLAPDVGAAPGAMVFRSDEVRKRLCGVGPLDRLGPEGYAPAVSTRVYETLLDNARTTIRNGHAAIVDAVFMSPADRHAVSQAAADASVPFVGCWLDAPEATLVARVHDRRHDASDADAEVIRAQAAQDTGPIEWHRVDASQPRDSSVAAVAGLVRAQLDGA